MDKTPHTYTNLHEYWHTKILVTLTLSTLKLNGFLGRIETIQHNTIKSNVHYLCNDSYIELCVHVCVCVCVCVCVYILPIYVDEVVI